jgi:hypothetical protein
MTVFFLLHSNDMLSDGRWDIGRLDRATRAFREMDGVSWERVQGSMEGVV